MLVFTSSLITCRLGFCCASLYGSEAGFLLAVYGQVWIGYAGYNRFEGFVKSRLSCFWFACSCSLWLSLLLCWFAAYIFWNRLAHLFFKSRLVTCSSEGRLITCSPFSLPLELTPLFYRFHHISLHFSALIAGFLVELLWAPLDCYVVIFIFFFTAFVQPAKLQNLLLILSFSLHKKHFKLLKMFFNLKSLFWPECDEKFWQACLLVSWFISAFFIFSALTVFFDSLCAWFGHLCVLSFLLCNLVCFWLTNAICCSVWHCASLCLLCMQPCALYLCI